MLKTFNTILIILYIAISFSCGKSVNELSEGKIAEGAGYVGKNFNDIDDMGYLVFGLLRGGLFFEYDIKLSSIEGNQVVGILILDNYLYSKAMWVTIYKFEDSKEVPYDKYDVFPIPDKDTEFYFQLLVYNAGIYRVIVNYDDEGEPGKLIAQGLLRIEDN